MTKSKVKMIFMNGRPVPKLCECGYYERVGNGNNVGSYFLDQVHGEWYCPGCGMTIPLR